MNITYNIGDIAGAAQQLWEQGKAHKVWAFYGPMGAGKTTLVHTLCNILQVNNAVSSPTFAIINEYNSPVAGSIFHMDLYRLKDEEDAIQAGVEDCLYSGNLCFVEWPEKAAGLLPDDTFSINIALVDNETRKIVVGEVKS